jgi:hypothetical protein
MVSIKVSLPFGVYFDDVVMVRVFNPRGILLTFSVQLCIVLDVERPLCRNFWQLRLSELTTTRGGT